MHLAKGSAALLLLIATTTHAQEAPSKIYADRWRGFTFQYPANWSLGQPLDQPIPFDLPNPLSLSGSVVATAISPGSDYKGTDFAGAELIVFRRYDSSPAACEALAKSVWGNASEVTVNGIEYTYVETSNAAMMKQRNDKLYTTSFDNICYIFDLALLTTGSGTDNGMRQLPDVQRDAIETQLQEILETVQLHPILPEPAIAH